MTRSTIFTIGPSGDLTAMSPAAPENEDRMQKLVADHPEIIVDGDGDLLLIRREQPISDRTDGGGRWSVDHLFVTRSGVPVLVELKRAVDTRLRREVVGQMLDYAANSTAYWQAGTIARSFAKTASDAGSDPSDLLEQFLQGQSSIEDFWEQVDANFLAGRIKMVFVADEIPQELARIVEFLNDQMRADVRAIELSWFEGSGITALTPRVIGETERAQTRKTQGTSKPAITRNEWIAEYFKNASADVREGIRGFIELVDAAGGHVEVARAQGSLIAVFDEDRTTIYPASLLRSGTLNINFKWLRQKPGLTSEDARKSILKLISSSVPSLTGNATTSASFPVEVLRDPAARSALRDALLRISSMTA